MATMASHGFPVVDVRVECYDGKYHSVDSSDMAFPSAAAHGLKEALTKAGAAVLEPISVLTVTVPEGYQGDVLGDLNSHGRVSGTSVLGNGNHEIVAYVPAAEIQRYAVDLRSMTGGRGTFVAVHDHYDLLPNHLIDKIKKASAPNAAPVHSSLSLGSCPSEPPEIKRFRRTGRGQRLRRSIPSATRSGQRGRTAPGGRRR